VGYFILPLGKTIWERDGKPFGLLEKWTPSRKCRGQLIKRRWNPLGVLSHLNGKQEPNIRKVLRLNSHGSDSSFKGRTIYKPEANKPNFLDKSQGT